MPRPIAIHADADYSFSHLGDAYMVRVIPVFFVCMWLLCVGASACCAAAEGMAPGAVGAAGASSATGGPDVAAIQGLLDNGDSLSARYGGDGAICSSLADDMAALRGVKERLRASMKRLFPLLEKPVAERLLPAYELAIAATERFEKTLSGAGELCTKGGDGRVRSSGYDLKLDGDATALVAAGTRLCLTLTAEVATHTWPQCSR